MYKKILSLTLVAILNIAFLAGCSEKSAKPKVPKWYLKKRVGYIVGVGSAKPNKSGDIDFQKNEAMINARSDLAKNLKAAVIAKDTQDKTKNQDGTIEENIEMRVKIITKKGLENAKILDSEFMDDGTLFVRIGVREDILNENEK
jgi:PBP1b-binding outer membrane lipoprotein LpoB